MPGREQPDSGSIRIGETVQLAYVEQTREKLDNNKTVWEAVSDGSRHHQASATTKCRRARISAASISRAAISKNASANYRAVSAGALQLACTLKEGGNLLLLDEPSNDLDVETLRALEEALLAFPGCAMVISHDRWFLDRIATHILAYEGDSQVVFFEGNFSEYHADFIKRYGEQATPHRMKYKRLK